MLKKRNLIFICLLILGVFLITSCLPKPPVTEGILKGQVIVPEGSKQLTGQALADATINIIDPATGDIIATTITDANGYYQVFVPAGGPYLLQAVKDGVKVQQFTPQVEVGMEYDLGTADCSTTTSALIAQAMMDAEDYPDDLADINLADIAADPNFNDVMNPVCSTIQAGEDPTESALVQQAIEDILHPPAPTPTPTPPSLSDAKTITAFDFKALTPDVVGVINEGAKTIALTVPFGTDVTALVPTIVHTGASVSPASDTAQDFTSPVTYTVTAEDTSTQAYLVTVTVAAPVIATTSTIANGATTPTLTVTGINFKVSIAAADLTVGLGTTTLTLGTVSFVSATEITVAFIGTAVAGDLTIQAKTSAFDPASLSVSNTLTVTVPAAAVINIAAIPEVTVPVTGATPVTTIDATAQYTGTVTWVPAEDPFQGRKVYVVTITLTPEAGFTLTGVAANFFTIAGAIMVTNAVDSSVVTAVFPATLKVGDSYGGGIIAYILQSGDPEYVAGEHHGLIAATADQSTGIEWITGGSTQTTLNGNTLTALGEGQANTNAMKAQTDYTGGAAKVCDDYTIIVGEVTYEDWFLPSKDELNKLCINQVAIGGFDDSPDGLYWSSTEYDANSAYLQVFALGMQGISGKNDSTKLVRAVRAPAREYFMALYYDLPAFNQGEIGAKKIKRQNFFIKCFCLFYLFLLLNIY